MSLNNIWNIRSVNNVTTTTPITTTQTTKQIVTTSITEDTTSSAIIYIEVSIMVLIFLISSIGNSLVVLIVCRKRKMQTVTNWLILNLAVADLSVSILCIPLEIPLVLNNYQWIYGAALCPILYPLQTISIYGSVLTLVALCVSRYWAILKPMKPQPCPKHAKICIAGIWVISIIVVIPYIMSLQYTSNPPSCSETMTKVQSTIYTVAIFTSQYLLPLTVICIAYVLIALDLKRGLGLAVAIIDRKRRKETTKVVKMLFIVTTTFAICVLPSHIVTLMRELKLNFKYIDIVEMISYILLYANSAFNPLIYNAFNESFRQGFKEYLNLKEHCYRNSTDGSSPLSSEKLLKSRGGRFMSGSLCSRQDTVEVSV